MADHDYPWIRAWGRFMKSAQRYIDDELRRARATKAPATAIYQRGDGTWATVADVTNPRTRRELGLET